MALTPPPAVPQRGDRATFSSRVDAFLTWLANLVGQLNVFLSQLTTLAAGGSYANPYTLVMTNQLIGTATGGNLYVGGNGTVLLIDTKDATGTLITALLNSYGSSTSTVKGTIKIQKVNDPSVWVIYSTGTFTLDTGGLYGVLTLPAALAGSAGSSFPFAGGESVTLFFQRTGDKGDSGNATPVIYVRNQLGNGTAPQTFSANTWNTVQLNNIPYSTIPGVTVSNGVISGLPAGTYWVEASSPCFSSGTHQSRFFNVTDGTVIDNGTSERNDSGTPLRVTRSFIRTAFTISSTKAVRIEHWTPLQTTNGSAASSGAGEIYGEIRLLKVA